MKIVKSALFFSSLLFSVCVFSGESAQFSVFIDLENGYAEGDMFTVRSSTNDVENIGCGRRISDFPIIAGLNDYAFCQATNSEGQYILCVTTDPDKMQVISTVSAYSYVLFAFDPADPIDADANMYDCKAIWVSHQSRYLPNTATDKDKVR